jgi:uncharacterized protein YndB with AHSA1/START domain
MGYGGAMTETQDIVLTRVLGAPVDAVWSAWAEPEQFTQWWGPTGFTSHSASIDLREGGRFVWNMRAPAEMGGFDMYNAGTYTRVVPGERIEFVQWLSDAEGNPIDPASMGMPADFPTRIRSELRFTAVGGGTELVAIEYDWADPAQREMSASGLEQCIDKLEAYLAREARGRF